MPITKHFRFAIFLTLTLLFTGFGWQPDHTQIFLIGDSTMADKPLADNPERGWGQLLPSFLDEKSVSIQNHAMNGRSTKSFIDEKRWDAVLRQLRPGDWAFIQFGHNDQKKEDPTRYAAPQTDYRTNLTRFVNEAKNKGANPILLTPVMRRRFDAAGKFFDTHGEYPDAVRALAAELKVPLIDLHKSSRALIEKHGEEESKKLFLWIKPGEYKSLPDGKKDDTHFSEYGAKQMAALVVNEIQKSGLALARFIKSPAPVQPLKVAWRNALNQKAEWYSSEEAIRIADNLLLYQRDTGGWPKNTEMAALLSDADKAALTKQKTDTDSTIDNSSTYTQLVYLARVFTATKHQRFQQSFVRGLDYLFKAQYDNGGWPQFYPGMKGYYMHVTFNDDAMIGVMTLLRQIVQRKPDYAFVDETRRQKAERAVERGIECILKTQIRVAGKLTAWCAQHDEKTLEPAPARTYEKISLSGSESVGIVRFLMGIEKPSPQIREAIESAIAWFRATKLTGIKVVEKQDATLPNGRDRVVVQDAAAPPIWARFYEIGTNRPIFCGRDGVIKSSLAEIEHERRNGYSWYSGSAGSLLANDYPAWQKKISPKQ